jgi:hypothetical protein
VDRRRSDYVIHRDEKRDVRRKQSLVMDSRYRARAASVSSESLTSDPFHADSSLAALPGESTFQTSAYPDEARRSARRVVMLHGLTLEARQLTRIR